LGLSIERKLPLAISALLALVLAIYLVLAYREVDRSARLATSERLSRAAGELAGLINQTQANRQTTLDRIAADSSVRAALRGEPSPAVLTTLGRLRLGGEGSQLPVLLLDPQHRVVRQLGNPPAEPAQQHLPRTLRDASERDGRVTYSRIFTDGKRAYFWTTHTIRSDRSTLGYIAQLRLLGSPTLQNPISSLIGPETTILFANQDDFSGRWIRLDGTVQEAPAIPHQVGVSHVHERNGAAHLAESVELQNAPWMIVLETPAAVTKARSAMFLRRTGLIGLGLIVAGTLIAWLVSRRFTGPMRELGNAAEQIAAGNYGERVAATRTDELGALAAAFNHMAGEVQRSISETEASRVEAEMANRVKSEFLANMSHEIRTPINAMLGYADLMDLGISGPLTDLQRSQLDRIRLSGKHLTSLIDDLLDFARIETGRLTVRKRSETAGDAIRTALTVVQPQADSKRVNLHVRCADELRYLGDRQRVEQILVNLLNNAIKFTPAGGDITLECQPDRDNGGAQVCFSVEDTGVGIEPERTESIFEAFVQGESGYTRAHGGSGLGLTISRRLAHMMDGELAVQSTVGKGSRFTLRLPATVQESGAEVQATAAGAHH
jgi:signal transduction histidine kinase